MSSVARFPYSEAESSLGMASSMPYLPYKTNLQQTHCGSKRTTRYRSIRKCNAL
jgi:hypothetical protein